MIGRIGVLMSSRRPSICPSSPASSSNSCVAPRSLTRRGRLFFSYRSVRLAAVLQAKGIEVREQPADANGITWYHVRQCPFHDDGRPFECGVGQKLSDGPYAGHCFHPEGVNKGWQDFKRALGLEGVGGARIHHDPAIVFGSFTGGGRGDSVTAIAVDPT